MQAVLTLPDISPELFSINVFGFNFALRWYALAYITGILVAWRLGVMAVRRVSLWQGNTPPMSPTQIEDLMTWIILGVILGGRFGFVVFYQPEYYLQNPIEILQVWQGGMSFHGGLLGVVTASWLFAWKHNIPKRAMADLIAHTVPFGLMLGRIANFTNGELWGRQSDLPWAVIFPGGYAQDCPGVVGLCARHPSQLYEAALEGLILGLVLLWMVYRRGALKFPGRIVGVFLAGYGAARFVVEFVRQPDAQFITLNNPLGLAFQINGYGLTMGQALSLPMIALGLWLIMTARAKAEQSKPVQTKKGQSKSGQSKKGR